MAAFLLKDLIEIEKSSQYINVVLNVRGNCAGFARQDRLILSKEIEHV